MILLLLCTSFLIIKSWYSPTATVPESDYSFFLIFGLSGYIFISHQLYTPRPIYRYSYCGRSVSPTFSNMTQLHREVGNEFKSLNPDSNIYPLQDPRFVQKVDGKPTSPLPENKDNRGVFINGSVGCAGQKILSYCLQCHCRTWRRCCQWKYESVRVFEDFLP